MTAAALSRRSGLPPTELLLTQGGDDRIALKGGRNLYGHAPQPQDDEISLGSSTASTISSKAFVAADALRSRLNGDLRNDTPAAVYRRHLDGVRGDLREHLNLPADVDILLAASGTDLHLIAARLIADADARPLSVVSVQASETGSGLDHALAGRHFGEIAGGVGVMKGMLLAGGTPTALGVFAVRDAQGGLIDAKTVEAAVNRLIDTAMADNRHVLLVVTDVTKTGLIAPRLDVVERLRHRWSERLTVLIDACQFRLSAKTIKAYLAWDCMVAVTGSKFLTGPAFSGALFVPPLLGERLSRRAPPEGLALYGARAHWPPAWVGGEGLPDGDNFGLLLRWRAALTELVAFKAVGEDQISGRLTDLAARAQGALAQAPWIAPLPTGALDRSALGCGDGWDTAPTIFPFRIRHPDRHSGFLGLIALAQVHRTLAARSEHLAPLRLGQPVSCGHDQGALRLCVSARHVVQAQDQPSIAHIAHSMGVAVQRLGENIHRTVTEEGPARPGAVSWLET